MHDLLRQDEDSKEKLKLSAYKYLSLSGLELSNYSPSSLCESQKESEYFASYLYWTFKLHLTLMDQSFSFFLNLLGLGKELNPLLQSRFGFTTIKG